MVLGFKQYFDKKKKEPTNFREKILAGAGYHLDYIIPGEKGLSDATKIPIKTKHPLLGYSKPKIHTFRSDPHNRWKPGMNIQMVYRGPNYPILDHFNKGIPELETLKSKQRIKIFYSSHFPFGKGYDRLISVDNRPLLSKEIDLLIKNDGFDSNEQFFRWFNKDWEGWILHFTDFRY